MHDRARALEACHKILLKKDGHCSILSADGEGRGHFVVFRPPAYTADAKIILERRNLNYRTTFFTIGRPVFTN
jgi:hypothetical protein